MGDVQSSSPLLMSLEKEGGQEHGTKERKRDGAEMLVIKEDVQLLRSYKK